MVVYLTLSSTRARVDLVNRLAKLDRVDGEERDTVLSLTRQLLGLAALRNRYSHCIYAFDPDDGRMRTIMMRISDRKDAIKVGQTDELDDAALSRIEEAIDHLVQLNNRIWQAMRTFDYPC